MSVEKAVCRATWPCLLPIACWLGAASGLVWLAPVFAQEAPRRLLAPPIQYSPGLAAPAEPIAAFGAHTTCWPLATTWHRGQRIGYATGGVPTYPWGYFGAQSRPYHVQHLGYYGNQRQWSFRRAD